MQVNEIGSGEVIAALAPIWTDKPEMARKVRSRIGQVLAFAKARGWRKDALPDARELRSGLSKQSRGKSFPALPFAEVPGFFVSELDKGATASRFAVLFAILAGARSGEVREANWEKIDHVGRTWTRTADDIKMKVGHVVTLSDAALALLDRWQPDKALRKGLIFAGTKGNALSDMSLSKALHSAHAAGIKAGRAGYFDPNTGKVATVHGFRSSFRDWAAERMPTMPAMVAEMALAHKVGNATEQAYLRSDLRAMRQELMDAWGRFVCFPGALRRCIQRHAPAGWGCCLGRGDKLERIFATNRSRSAWRRRTSEPDRSCRLDVQSTKSLANISVRLLRPSLKSADPSPLVSPSKITKPKPLWTRSSPATL